MAKQPRLLISYFIGIDKKVHMDQGAIEIRKTAITIDDYIGKIMRGAESNTLIILCGDHPIHAGSLRRESSTSSVALILDKISKREKK